MLTAIQQEKDLWETLADRILSNFNFNYPDEIDIEYICKRYGMRIINTRESASYSIPTNGRRGTIYLATELDWMDRRMISGEEFCHLYAHHSPQLQQSKIVINKTEKQAQKMLAYLLMPYRFIKQIDLKENTGYLVSEIAEEFLVTEELANLRLELLFKQKVNMMAKFRGQVGAIRLFE